MHIRHEIASYHFYAQYYAFQAERMCYYSVPFYKEDKMADEEKSTLPPEDAFADYMQAWRELLRIWELNPWTQFWRAVCNIPPLFTEDTRPLEGEKKDQG